MAVNGNSVKSFSRAMSEWYMGELIRIVSRKHGNPVPVTIEEVSRLTDSELEAWTDKLLVIAKTPPG